VTKFLIYITSFVFLLSACANQKDWKNAQVIFFDDFEKDMLIKANPHSYYNFIKAKEDLKSKRILLIPEEIKSVNSLSQKYVSMFFDEDTYGMESYSFGHSLAGDSIMLVETKYQMKTCACKTSGTYFKDYFLVYKDSILKIKTDSKYNIYNRYQIYEFIDKYSKYNTPQGINNIEDIIYFLENINN